MPSPKAPYDAVLHAARDITRVRTALEAELLAAALLGSVYAVSDPPRVEGLREFVGGFLRVTARRRTAAARAVRTAFAALVPDAEGAAAVRPGTGAPPWSGQLGRVRPAGTWAYGDVFGDQTSYLTVFAYDDPESGGEEHAVVVLVDHNLGIVKDLFVSRPAAPVLDTVRRAAEEDELVWFAEVDEGELRARVETSLEITDSLTTLPDDGALATDRALVGARLAVLPPPAAPVGVEPPAVPDPARLTAEFLASPQGAALDQGGEDDAATLRYAVRLILDFAGDSPDRDPLRWSPAVVGLFLLDWVHRRAVLDDDDVSSLPGVVAAWTAWSAQRRGLPPAALRATGEALESMAPEFIRLHRTGERRSEAAEAVGRLLADGVDPADGAAVGSWLAAGGGVSDRHDPGAPPPAPEPPGANGSSAGIPRPR
jgi:hypothetical protein